MLSSEGTLSVRRLIIVLMTAALAMTTIPAAADDHGGPPDFSKPHAHALLVHAKPVLNDFEFAGGPVLPTTYRRCVDLAGGEALRTNNHHETLHQGRAGRALVGAGHLVVPMSCGPAVDGYIAAVNAALDAR